MKQPAKDVAASAPLGPPGRRGGRVTYHLVDLRGDGYRVGYLDTDVRILFACFKLFEEFYRNEYPGPVKWEHSVAREIEVLHASSAVEASPRIAPAAPTHRR